MERENAQNNGSENGHFNPKDFVVAKYGGSSLANAYCFRLVADIIKQDRSRKFIVLSAPGKDSENDIKITDLLLSCAASSCSKSTATEAFKTIVNRFEAIGSDLGMREQVLYDLDYVEKGLQMDYPDQELKEAWVASRGEWLSARILARYLDATFVDAADIIRLKSFNNESVFDPQSNGLIRQKLSGPGLFVVPGYYGRDGCGNIRVFPRGGSDTTGSCLAAAINVKAYENWTDVDGVKTADPAIEPDAQTIDKLTMEELAELANNGARVFHPDALDPLWNRDIPIIIRNTFNPDHPGTTIV